MHGLTHILRTLNVLELFAEKSHDFPTQYAITFLCVAKDEGCSNIDLMETTNLSTAAVTRNIQALSPYRDRAKKLPGYNLVYSEVDPDDNRRRMIYLTQQGHELLAEVLHRMGVDEKTTKEIKESGRKAISREEVPETYFAPATKVYENAKTQEEGN